MRYGNCALLVRMYNDAAAIKKKKMKVLQKIKNEVPCGPTIPLWGCIFKGDENGTSTWVFTLLSLLQYYLQ